MLLLRKKLRNDWSRPAASARPPSPAGRVQTGPSTRPDIPFPHSKSGSKVVSPSRIALLLQANHRRSARRCCRRRLADRREDPTGVCRGPCSGGSRAGNSGGMAGTSASGAGEEAPPGGAGRGGTGGLRQGRKALAMRGPRPTTSSTSADPGSDDDAANEVADRPRTRASSRGGGANSPMRAAPGTAPLPPAGKSR